MVVGYTAAAPIPQQCHFAEPLYRQRRVHRITLKTHGRDSCPRLAWSAAGDKTRQRPAPQSAAYDWTLLAKVV
jgi:hypothetical protein